MSDSIAFGSAATTIIFSIVISVAIAILLLVSFFSSKYSLRAMVGIYDPVIKSWDRYSYMLDDDSVRMIQPYVLYHGLTYFMFGNSNVGGFGNKIKKLNVLTNSQLNEFFPLKTYKQWMNGGKEEVQNLNKGKLGYRENFDEEKISEVENRQDEIDQEITNQEINQSLLDLRQMLEPTRSHQKSLTRTGNKLDQNSIHSQIEEQDIVDMLPATKIQYTATALSIPSNTNPLEAEKHYSSGICAICLDDLEDNDNVRGLLCGHVFHDLCIDPWLTKRKGCCPTCKKDLYLEVTNFENRIQDNNNNNDSNGNENDNNDGVPNADNTNDSSGPTDTSRWRVNINDIIHLPVGEPGSRDIDELFSLNENNLYSFFLILIITKLKSDILLCALEYLRNNNYSLDNQNDNTSTNDVDDVEIDDIIDFSADITRPSYFSKKIERKFEQLNISDSFKTPPLPDLNKLNPQIKKIIEHYPRPFQPADLVDLDKAAWLETKRMRRGVKGLAYKALDISTLELYYHNVVKLYGRRQMERLSS